MPNNTDLSVSPYFDDYSDLSKYYKVLFKPGVAVQVRELNQLHSILQNQIEKFGNNIYKRGTIIDGVNFIYYPDYSYIKINDSQLDGQPAVPASYVGNFITDPTTNLVAHIVNSKDGFESTDPDLKTLYVRYINSGDSGEESAFASSSTLKIYDHLDSVHTVTVSNGSSGFSNNDTVVFCSALAVTQLTNTEFTVGETISMTGNTNFAIIDGVDNVRNNLILKLRPRQADLTNTEISSTIWEFTAGEDIIGSTSGATATILEIVGTGATASIKTSADIGKITNVAISDGGNGYYVAPYVTIKSSGIDSTVGARNYNDLDLVARNFVAQVTVSGLTNSVGKGYAFGVTDGVIYQKGYFTTVEAQTVIVSPYNSVPDQLAVGFETIETIVDSNSDQSLLDNSTGTRNEFAPGADRLMLEPTLVVKTSDEAAANDEFLTITEFSEGRAFRENKRTQYSTIYDEMALRTNEQAGDFVLNKFLVTTRSTANQSNEGQYLTVITDPGKGYINGYRVETTSNYATLVEKGVDYRSGVNLSSTIDYGNYITITEVAGRFNCSTGETINLLNTARQFVSNTTLLASGTIPTAGDTVIGTARVRNMTYDSGKVGTASVHNRLYLFDIQMNSGYSFSSVRAVRTQDGDSIADVVLDFDATLNSSICKLKDTASGSSLIISSGTDAAMNIGNLTYIYRTTVESVNLANNGTASYLLSDANEYMGYSSASLTDAEKKSINFVPTSGDIILTAGGTDGTVNVGTSSNVVSVSNTAMINTYDIGDFIALYSGASTYVVRRVTSKTSSTLVVDSNVSFSNTAANFSRAFPKHVPVPLDRISGASVTLTNGNKTLNINLGTTTNATADTTCTLGFDVRVEGATVQSKTADRGNYVKLDLSSAGVNGPWCLGVPDVFRLKKVYLGADSSVSVASTDVTDQFYIDHNQTSDYYGLGYIYKKKDASVVLKNTSWLLVEFDAFTSTPGVFAINSYVSANTAQRFADDSLTLGSLGTKVNSFEVPEVYTSDGKYFDLLNCIDFRPLVANTAAYSKTVAGATVNPAETVTFSGTNKKFPLPESAVSYNRDNFMGRTDIVVVSTDNSIKIVRGVPSDSDFAEPEKPKNTLLLNKLTIPAYPCVPQKISTNTRDILTTRMANEKLLLRRIKNKTVKSEVTDFDIEINQPKPYTMSDISKLERRINDLEYNVSLSSVEADLRDRVIPSAISPDINRFKFGFYADNYQTSKNSDVDNVEYNVNVIGSRVVPMSETSMLSHGNGYKLGTYTDEYALIRQDIASEYVSPTAPVSNNTTVVVTTATAFRSQRNISYNKQDIFPIVASSLAGTIKIDYNFFGADDRLVVKKGTTVLYDNTMRGIGTINIAHDPSTGRNYTLQTTLLSSIWQYTVTYPVDSTTATSTSAPSTRIRGNRFSGHITNMFPSFMSPSNVSLNFNQPSVMSKGGTMNVSVAGLKPNTKHQLKVTDAALSVKGVVSLNSTNGNGYYTLNSTSTVLASDAFGQISFDLIVSTIQSAFSDPSAASLPSRILVYLESSDLSSSVGFYVNTKSFDVNSVTSANTSISKVLTYTSPLSIPPHRLGAVSTVIV